MTLPADGVIPMRPRLPRCRVLSTRTADKCPNPAVSDFGMCIRHLAGAHAEYEALLTEARIRHPALASAGDVA